MYSCKFLPIFPEHTAITEEMNAMGLGSVVTVRPYRLQGNKIIANLLNLMYSIIDIRLRSISWIPLNEK